jgi:hypothetical protein
MLVTQSEFYEAYQALLADAKTLPLTLLVSCADADSAAAFRLLRSLLKADGAAFSAFAVSGFEDLQRKADELKQSDPLAVRARRHSLRSSSCAAFARSCSRA